jgi:aconitase A
MDGPTFSEIEAEIRESVEEYIPGIKITKITVNAASDGEENKGTFIEDDQRVFTVTNIGQLEHTAKVRIDTPGEADYFRHGGILPYVLRQLAAS